MRTMSHRAPDRLPLLLALSLLAVACEKPAAKPSTLPAAVIGPAIEPLVAAASDVVVLRFDPASSTIGFTGVKVTGAHTGSFQRFSGEVRRGATEAQSSVSLSIDMDSVSTDHEKLTAHLKGSDFFDVARHPTATFHSTVITAGAAAPATHTIRGNLTLRGVTKEISFPATVTTAPDRLTLTAAFALDRKAFGISYPGKADDLIRDDVDVFLDIAATPAPPSAPAPAPNPAPSPNPAPPATPTPIPG